MAAVLAPTYRRRLWAQALDQHGYVTTANADDLGVPPVELRKLAHRGHLENVGRGVYRFTEMPSSERDSFMEAVLWVGPGAVLAQDAVLALHGLAFANPRALRVATPHRIRKTQIRSDVLIVRGSISPNDRTTYFGIPSTTVERALIDCRDLVARSRLDEAAGVARRQGLLLASEYDSVVDHLGGHLESQGAA